jgi:hypothetical protein
MTGYAAAETALVMFVQAVVATLTRRTLQPFTRRQGGGDGRQVKANLPESNNENLLYRTEVFRAGVQKLSAGMAGKNRVASTHRPQSSLCHSI